MAPGTGGTTENPGFLIIPNMSFLPCLNNHSRNAIHYIPGIHET